MRPGGLTQNLLGGRGVARATIKDIARVAKVSPMTVSNVINGRRAKASDETVARIMAAVEELGYRPNMSARSLVSNASKMVGVIIPFTENRNQLLLDNPFYAEMISGIESALRANGYYMMLSGVGEVQRSARHAVALEHGRAHRPRGLSRGPLRAAPRAQSANAARRQLHRRRTFLPPRRRRRGGRLPRQRNTSSVVATAPSPS
jgi:transcriptional regulator with XRE-family HTH domain